MSDVVVDTSTWVEFLAGRPAPELEAALAQGAVVLPPLVVAELVSGARSTRDRASVVGLLHDLPVHDTPFEHWVRVGELRRRLQHARHARAVPTALARRQARRFYSDKSGEYQIYAMDAAGGTAWDQLTTTLDRTSYHLELVT